MRSVIWLAQNSSSSIRVWDAVWNHSCYGYLGSVTITSLQMSSSLNDVWNVALVSVPAQPGLQSSLQTNTSSDTVVSMFLLCTNVCFLVFPPVILQRGQSICYSQTEAHVHQWQISPTDSPDMTYWPWNKSFLNAAVFWMVNQGFF